MQEAPEESTTDEKIWRLDALPRGAVLDGRYTVRDVIERGPPFNVYRVRVRSGQRCPSCGAIAAPVAQSCSRCGAELTDLSALPSYLVVEAAERGWALSDRAVLEQGLNHPHLAALVDAFDYAPYGAERHYSVAEEQSGVFLERIALPQPVERVLGWGFQLSEALSYLHKHGVSIGVGPDNVLIAGDEAMLTDLHLAVRASREPEERLRGYAGDISQLAATLYQAITGHPAVNSPGDRRLPETMPPQLEAALSRALRPDRSDPPLTDEAWHHLLAGALEEVLGSTPSLRIRSGRISDVGRRRELNEDSLSVVEWEVLKESGGSSVGVYVVADGMGGHAGGEMASGLAIATLNDRLLRELFMPRLSSGAKLPDAEITDRLTDAVQAAAKCVHDERIAQANDMGTTLVAAVVSGQTAYVANVGDSRAYILKPEGETEAGFRQITVDHSLVQQLVSMGQITEEEAKSHPYRNMIYKSLGEQAEVEIDMFVERLTPGTRILICSDGLSGMVPDDRLREVISSESDPQTACTRLVEAANEAGGTDNITALAVYIEAA